MDKRSTQLMDYIAEAIDYPDVSGFEALELLDVRSRMASREPLLEDVDKIRLEGLDRQLLQMVGSLLERISEVAGLSEISRKPEVRSQKSEDPIFRSYPSTIFQSPSPVRLVDELKSSRSGPNGYGARGTGGVKMNRMIKTGWLDGGKERGSEDGVN
jgi:hypothetical protein